MQIESKHPQKVAQKNFTDGSFKPYSNKRPKHTLHIGHLPTKFLARPMEVIFRRTFSASDNLTEDFDSILLSLISLSISLIIFKIIFNIDNANLE